MVMIDKTIPKARHAKFRKIALVVALLFLGLSIYNLAKYKADQNWIRAAAHRTGIDTRLPAAERALLLSKYIRSHVHVEGAPVENRPFLRASARQTLTERVGYCGEATRAYISLARVLGLNAQRLNLHGPLYAHVVPEVEVAPGQWRIYEIQNSPVSNPVLDRSPSVDEVVADGNSPYREYSNINLRRIPIINIFVTRLRVQHNGLMWFLENPALIRSVFCALIAAAIMVVVATDAFLMRHYVRRFHLRHARPAEV